jgi:hypothetical protein
MLSSIAIRPGRSATATVPCNSLIGPGIISLDASADKRFQLGGSKLIELRVDAFNLPNRPIWNQRGSQLRTPNFGVITAPGWTRARSRSEQGFCSDRTFGAGEELTDLRKWNLAHRTKGRDQEGRLDIFSEVDIEVDRAVRTRSREGAGAQRCERYRRRDEAAPAGRAAVSGGRSESRIAARLSVPNRARAVRRDSEGVDSAISRRLRRARPARTASASPASRAAPYDFGVGSGTGESRVRSCWIS